MQSAVLDPFWIPAFAGKTVQNRRRRHFIDAFSLVGANRERIARMERKVQAALARVWGEAGPGAAEA